MDRLVDPESLHGREDVAFAEETVRLDEDEADAVREDVGSWDSHAVVGVTSHVGDVLLMNDGSHGWTLLAVPVADGDDWVGTARRGVAALAGLDVGIERAERVRRIDYYTAGGDERMSTLYNVVFRTPPVAADAVTTRATVDEDGPAVEWFDRVPDGVAGEVADDIRLFVD